MQQSGDVSQRLFEGNHAVQTSGEYSPNGTGRFASRSNQRVRDGTTAARAALLPACPRGTKGGAGGTLVARCRIHVERTDSNGRRRTRDNRGKSESLT
eukprot:scaffold1095_cov328-Pavlova_lutheri.AAC.3